MRLIQGYILLAFAMATVGSTVIAGKWMAGVGPFTANALRLALALPALLVTLRWSGQVIPRLCRHDRWLLVAQAAIGNVGYTALLFLGLRLTTAANAGVILGTLPVVTLLLSILLLGERPSGLSWLVIMLAASGVWSMTAGQKDGGSLEGDLLVGAAVLCEGTFILLNRRLYTTLSPLALSTLLVALGLIGSVIPAAFELAAAPHLPLRILLGASYYAFVPTFAGFIAWYAGSARVSATDASLFTAVAPLVAMILSVVLLGERLSEHQLIGGATVVGAVALQTLPRRSRRCMQNK